MCYVFTSIQASKDLEESRKTTPHTEAEVTSDEQWEHTNGGSDDDYDIISSPISRSEYDDDQSPYNHKYTNNTNTNATVEEYLEKPSAKIDYLDTRFEHEVTHKGDGGEPEYYVDEGDDDDDE